VSGVWDSAQVSNVWGSAQVSGVRDSARVFGVRDSAQVSGVGPNVMLDASAQAHRVDALPVAPPAKKPRARKAKS
jgi:hypothetical protein